MPPKRKCNLKQSTESRASRGLPNPKQKSNAVTVVEKRKVTNHEPPHYKYLYSSSSEVDKITSMNNGLDRCASLLNALLSSPKVKTTIAKPLFNNRLLSSTPAFTNAPQVITSEYPCSQPIQQGTYNDDIKATVYSTMTPINIVVSSQSALPEDGNTLKENASLNLLLKSITEKLSLNEEKVLFRAASTTQTIPNDHIPSAKSVESNNIKCQANNFHTVNIEETNIDHKEKNVQSKSNSDESHENKDVSFQQSKLDLNNLPSASKSMIKFDSVEKVKNNDLLTLFLPSCINSQLPVCLNPSDTNNTHLTTLKYLLKELRDMINIKACGFELNQLFEEIDYIVGLLPFSMAKSADNNECYNDQLLQLLKIENADLKQSLLNFHNELEKLKLNEKKINQKDNNELYQKILIEEENNLKLSNQIQEVIMVAEELRKENENLWKHISMKDKQFNENLDAWLIERCKLIEEHTKKQDIIEEYETRNKSYEETNNILQVSIKQRDTEINRLVKLNRDLQQSVTNLLLDINAERNKKVVNLESNKKIITHQLAKNNLLPVKALNLPRCTYNLKESSINSEPAFSSIDFDINLLSTCKDATNSFTLGCTIGSVVHETDSCMSTLKSSDSSDFQKDLQNLNEEILRIQKSLTRDY